MNTGYASNKHLYEIDGTKVIVKKLVDLYGQKVVAGRVKTKKFNTPQEALVWIKDSIEKDKQ